MSIDNWGAALAVGICLCISFFFSASETSVTAASRASIHALAQSGNVRAGIVDRLFAMRERLIGTILIGNNLVNTLAASLTTSALLNVFGDVGIAYATVVVSILVIVFAEVLPKSLAINNPDRVALAVSRPISWIVWLMTPVTIATETIVRLILKILRIDLGKSRPVLSPAEELRGQVNLMHKDGEVEKGHRDMLGGVLDLEELSVADVMVHRTKMRVLPADQPAAEIIREVLASPYTRFPMWRERPENIIGFLHAKDLLRALDAAGGDPEKVDVPGLMLPAWFVPDSTMLKDQLKAFLKRKTHFALVVDEYGEVEGLVTLEDILEEIVGDIKDEHDTGYTGVRPQPDGSALVDGAVPVRDVNRLFDWNLPDEEATTMAGLVIHEARIIPEAGQVFTFHGFRFEVARKQRNRITSLKVTPLEPRKKKPEAGTLSETGA